MTTNTPRRSTISTATARKFLSGFRASTSTRDTQTGKVYEETANIEGRLRGIARTQPMRHRVGEESWGGKRGNLDYSTVTLLIIDNHLHVYLARHEVRPADMPAAGPAEYGLYKVYEIYPSDYHPRR